MNGLVGGRVYGAPPLTSMRRILPSSRVLSCALPATSPGEPPSPVPMYRYPSGPNVTMPPLWLAYVGWLTERIVCAEPRSAQTILSVRSEEHTSELQSPYDIVWRLLLEKKN